MSKKLKGGRAKDVIEERSKKKKAPSSSRGLLEVNRKTNVPQKVQECSERLDVDGPRRQVRAVRPAAGNQAQLTVSGVAASQRQIVGLRRIELPADRWQAAVSIA
jgi:hypothetical protein